MLIYFRIHYHGWSAQQVYLHKIKDCMKLCTNGKINDKNNDYIIT